MLVPGGNALYMLSSSKDRYLGVAYIGGLIDDSLLNSLDDPAFRWETVELE